ncbi:hypothetical protein STEG23_017173, partial [Scotinomys teguina]
MLLIRSANVLRERAPKIGEENENPDQGNPASKQLKRVIGSSPASPGHSVLFSASTVGIILIHATSATAVEHWMVLLLLETWQYLWVNGDVFM